MGRRFSFLVYQIPPSMGLLALLPWAASTGEYHYAATLLCYDCHTMHFSQSHNWDGSTPVPTAPTANGTGNWLGSTGPNSYLLKAPDDRSQLCLACHDGQTFAPDVIGANTGNHVRQAGALTTGTAPYEAWKGHTVGVTAVPPGGTMRIKLQCINCHGQHGNSNYRNLDNSTFTITYAKGTNDLTKDVFLRSWTLGAIATNYSVENVDFNEPNQQQSAMGKYCRGCHTDFHGQKGDSNMGGASGTGWLRHPTAGADIGTFASDGQHSSLDVFRNRLYRVKVMSPSGDWGTQGAAWPAAPSTLTPTCITCHKAHGNKNPFGLIFLAGTGPLTEEGDAAGNTGGAGAGLRALCGQCHVQ